MNDKYFALKEEAMNYACSKVPLNQRYNDIFYDIVQGKLSELIVNQCSKVIEEHAKRFPEADTTWRCAMIESARVVKEHFGVEE